MELVNLTPHTINLNDTALAPSGQTARVKVDQVQVGTLDLQGQAIPVVANTYGQVEGLPEPQLGVGYVVSGLVLQALEAQGIYRGDVFAPDTGPTAIRGENGQIKAVTRLVGMNPR
ncbi:MAG: hypothetical protein N2047_06250 [Meiothermus sp.]|jgi:hypothetical protein|nr:hypothetical protein [Meiothermus sp.]